MEFQLLGPFEARHDGTRIPLETRRQERCLLAILLLDAGSAVSIDRLIDLLWHGQPPASARGTVHTYIGRLRTALAPYGVRVETVGDGYRADPGGHVVDVHAFTALAGRAAEAVEPAEQIRLFDRALALWRGPLLADVADDLLRERLGGPLGELRLTAIEHRAEAHLALGHHDRVVADLTPLAALHAGRERLVAAQMTALYRSGRQAEALELYRTARRVLVDEHGIEPGAALKTLHDRILHADPRMDRPRVPVHAVRVGGVWLPWNTSGHPALEFCNTYAGWGGPPLPGSDWLPGYTSLAVWAGHHDLADEWVVKGLLRRAAEDPAAAEAALEEAREFRTRLYACLTVPDEVRAFKAVAPVVEEAAAASVLVRGEDGLGRWRTSPSAGLRLPLLAAAHGAGELLCDPARFLVRSCPGAGCGWLFLDESGRRRWCSLQTCGHGTHMA